MALQQGFNYLDDTRYIWYNPGINSLFSRPSATWRGTWFETTESTYSKHNHALGAPKYNYAVLNIDAARRTQETWISFNLYNRGSLGFVINLQNEYNAKTLLAGGATFTDYYGGTGTSELNKIFNVVIHQSGTRNRLFEWYVDGELAASYTKDPLDGSPARSISLTTDSNGGNTEYSSNIGLISDIVITNDAETGAKLIEDPESVIDDGEKITENGLLDTIRVVEQTETVYYDIHRRVAEAAYYDAEFTTKHIDKAYYDTERDVKDSRHITEFGYLDTSRTTKRDEKAYYDTERNVSAATLETAYYDITRDTVRIERGDWDTERKTPYKAERKNGEMYLGEFPAISVDVRMTEGTLSDTVSFRIVGEMFPKAAMVGSLLDYNIDMEIERTSQQKGIQTCESVYKMDEILFHTYRYPTLGNAKASYHLQRMAAAMGLNPVFAFEDFTPENNYSDNDVTYQNVISGMFGWTKELPWRCINIFIRDGNLYAIQRGNEPNTIDISTIPHSYPQIDRSVMREFESITVTAKSKYIQMEQVITKFSGWIVNGDFRALYTNGLCTEQIQGGSHTYNEYDPNTEQLVRTRTDHADGSYSETRYEQAYSMNNQVVETTEYHINRDKDGNTTTETVYNANLGNGMSSSTSFRDGEYAGRSTGHGSITGTPTQYTIEQANIALGARPEWNDGNHTITGITNPWPVKDMELVAKMFKEVQQYDRTIQETVSIDLTPEVVRGVVGMNHIIDFNDKITLDGNEYFLVSNNAHLGTRDFAQSLQLVRWF